MCKSDGFRESAQPILRTRCYSCAFYLNNASGASRREGEVVSGFFVIASEAKQSISPRKERMDCFAALAMTVWLFEI